MLARLLAVWIIVLAASPFTQPFSTVTLEWLFGDSARPHSPLPSLRSASVGTVELEAVPSNPPVEVSRAGPQSHRDTSPAASGSPVENDVVSQSMLERPCLEEAVEWECSVACAFAVLRL